MNVEPIYLVGPTAVGKSETAINLGKTLGAEIVSADSMQIYRGMDIGTAKPTPEQLRKLPHHLIGILDLSEVFSVSRFKKIAEKTIAGIRERGHVPLVVGGTGLYVKSLTEGIFEGPSANWDYRKELRVMEKEDGPGCLYEKLKLIDPRSAERIERNDLRRIIRALEVFHLTGKPISEHQKEWASQRPDITIIGLDMERELLNKRINERVDEMFRAGLVDETKRLLDLGLEGNHTAMQAIGYKEVVGYLRDEFSLEHAEELVKRNSRRYAKRQMTWFRKDDRIKWFNIVHQTRDDIPGSMIEYVKSRGYETV